MSRHWERLEPRALLAASGSDHFLVSTPGRIEERTVDGQLVRSIPILADGNNNSGVGENRDLVVADGKLWIYDGDFGYELTARLRALDLSTGQWRLYESDPPWATSNNGVNGNVGVVGDYVFFDAHDAPTTNRGDGPVRRLDLRTGEFAQVDENRDYQDLVVGLDGFVYATEYSYTVFGDGTYGKIVYVYDPETLETVKTLDLRSDGSEITCLCVDADGDIYAGGVQLSWYYHYDGDGNVVEVADSGLTIGCVDMDLAPDGRIVIGTRGYGVDGIPGEAVIVTDTSFDHFARLDFNLGSNAQTFVAFGSLGGVDPSVASIAGNVFDDANFNGVRDAGEAALAGWQVYIDQDNDGSWGWYLNEPVATTSYTGRFEFRDLPTGQYTIRVRPAKGFIGTTRESHTVNVPLLGTVVKRFGATRSGTVHGYVFHDVDTDGVRDAGEAGIAGARVFVDFDNDGVLDENEPSMKTGAAGRYVITGLTPGSYRVRQKPLRGWVMTTPRSFSFTVGSGGTSSKRFGEVLI